MSNELLLVRGLPGSGKSTFAKTLRDYKHLEADMFFTDALGNYCYDHERIKEAHNWCQRQTLIHLRNGLNVVVSNTFVRAWEMLPYFRMGYPTRVLTVIGIHKNAHSVPESVVERMQENWEPLELIDYLGD